jgi:hypothetical protein
VTQAVAESCQDFVTTVTLDHDVVPRTSVKSCQKLVHIHTLTP